MSVLIAEAVLLVLLIGISILIIVDQRLMSSVITYCAVVYHCRRSRCGFYGSSHRNGIDCIFCHCDQIDTKKARNG